MQLTVENLGPIKKGEIRLDKNLTLFTGRNNTGKSYLTYLIYGISQYEILNGMLPSINKLQDFYKNLLITKQYLQQELTLNIPDIINDNITDIENLLVSIIEENYPKIFASLSVKPKIKLFISDIQSHTISQLESTAKAVDNELYWVSSDGKLSKINLTGIINHQRFPTYIDKFAHLLTLIVAVGLDRDVNVNTVFFPAERTAINLFAKHITATKAEIKDELDSEVIAGMSDEELGRRLRTQVKTAPKYPYALRSYINFVNEFKRGEEGAFTAIATKIEEVLTGGKVHLDQFEQLLFTPNGSKAPLELHMTSSLVKSLSYLILYLRYTAKQGDQIIIDEPELNLHPDLQIELAKIIAEMVNAGLKIIISTHSDYLIKELNNLLLLNELYKFSEHKEFIDEQGYNSEHLLKREEVVAYFLNGESIVPIDLKENGIEVSTINDAMTRVDSLAGEVYFRLQEATSEE